jgi:DNA-binding GntR family transcriptional regulator
MITLIESGTLLKEQLASQLKDAIMQGRLRPGDRVIEGAWAREFGAAQASVREAINLLIAEGFLVKSAGRSARVTQYTEAHIARIYEVRGALEGLAAQLASSSSADLTGLESALARMEDATRRNHVRDLVQNDLAFHLALTEASGNPVLIDLLGRLLRPLFGFVLLRMMETHESTLSWTPDLPRHREIIYLIRDSTPEVARQFVEHCVQRRFVSTAHAVWWPDDKPKRRRRS